MKNSIVLFIITIICSITYAQPQFINYQGIAKHANGSPVANETISVKISIFGTNNALNYEETHITTTNDIGLYVLLIGNGNPTGEDFTSIDWSDFNKEVEISIDFEGGNNFIYMGRSPFATVPYALYAEGLRGPQGLQGPQGVEGGKGLPGPPGAAGECSCPPPWDTGEGEEIFYNNGNVGIGTDNPNEQLHVVGNICYTGTNAACSDKRYKTNIQQISNALQNIMKISGVTYNWKIEDFKDENFTDKTQVGVIAQEIEPYFPALVVTNDKGFKSVDYPKLTAVLIEAMKQQQELITQLQDQNRAANSKVKQIDMRLKLLESSFVSSTQSK